MEGHEHPPPSPLLPRCGGGTTHPPGLPYGLPGADRPTDPLSQLSTNFVVSCRGARRRSPPLFRAPRRGRPQPPWSSRCRSDRVRPLRPSRCVRLRSHHAAPSPGHTMHHARQPSAMLAPPLGGCRLQTSACASAKLVHPFLLLRVKGVAHSPTDSRTERNPLCRLCAKNNESSTHTGCTQERAQC
eukprot:scaffold111988_cov36-Tisochrysis_lutea.AAC.2